MVDQRNRQQTGIASGALGMLFGDSARGEGALAGFNVSEVSDMMNNPMFSEITNMFKSVFDDMTSGLSNASFMREMLGNLGQADTIEEQIGGLFNSNEGFEAIGSQIFSSFGVGGAAQRPPAPEAAADPAAPSPPAAGPGAGM